MIPPSGPKKTNPNKPNFQIGRQTTEDRRQSTVHGATAAHYTNLDCRQTSFELGTRCAFQIDPG